LTHFFFQAEDGIRDFHVTEVQTCALPIFREDIVRMLDDPDPNVVIQAMLTINLLDWPDAAELIQATVPKHRARGVREIGRQLLRSEERRVGKESSAGWSGEMW